MVQYIEKDALVAEIERRIESCAKQREDMLNEQCHTLADDASARMCELRCFQDFINTYEVKEVDLEKETKEWWKERLHLNPEDQLWMDAHQSIVFAKHFFELGLQASNPITAADRGTAGEIIINLKRVESDYRINLTKEIEWIRNQVKK